MLRKRTALFSLAMLLAASAAEARPDFFGIKMKSEDFAQNMQIQPNPPAPDFSESRPGTDKRVYAYAFLSGTVGGGRGVSVQVYNHSDKPMATEKLFREMTLVTWSGKRYDRSETEMMRNRDQLGPGENATFNFTFPGIRIPKEEIKMIVCSFDLGGTTIVLMPIEKEVPAVKPPKKSVRLLDRFKRQKPAKEPAAQDKNKTKETKAAPPAKTAEKNPQQRPAEKSAEKPAEHPASKDAAGKRAATHSDGQAPQAKTAMEHCVTPIKFVQALFRNFGGKKPKDAAPSAPPSSPGAQATAAKAPEAEAGRAEAVSEPQSKPAVAAPQAGVRDTPASVASAAPGESEAARASLPDEDRKVPAAYPLVKASQVIEGTRYNFLPTFKKEVEEAEEHAREAVHADRPWSLENPDKLWTRREKLGEIPAVPRREAEVVHVNSEYGFVVVNAGYQEGLDKNMILEVLRNGRKIGKVMVTKPRPQISGAIILPEWRTRDEISVGDRVGISA